MEDKNIQMALRIAKRAAELGGRVYYVGGLVRDRVLGRENKDVDIEVHGITPKALEGILRSLGTPTVMGASFGVYGLAHHEIDISMPRTADGDSRGKADFQDYVNPFIGPMEAARRRDFTMNALMQDVLTGEILDFFGGVSDIQHGIIRHVADDTFAEDPLRVLRAAQFAARMNFELAEETVSFSGTLDLKSIAHERIFAELEKALLKAPKPSRFFEALRQMEQLEAWFPEVKALIGVKQEPQFHPEGDVWNHTMLVLDEAAKLRGQAKNPLGLMLSALCHDFGKTEAMQIDDRGRIRAFGHEAAGVPLAKRFLSRLTKERNLIKYVQNMTLLHMRPNLMAAQHSGTKALCHLYDESVCPQDLLLLAKADHLGRPNAADYSGTQAFLQEKLEAYTEILSRPYVRGADLVAAGYKPGPQFKQALDYAHKLRLAGVDKESALKQTIALLRKKM